MGQLAFECCRADRTKIAIGPYDDNAYLLRCTETGEPLLIDAAAEPERLPATLGRPRSPGSSDPPASGPLKWPRRGGRRDRRTLPAAAVGRRAGKGRSRLYVETADRTRRLARELIRASLATVRPGGRPRGLAGGDGSRESSAGSDSAATSLDRFHAGRFSCSHRPPGSRLRQLKAPAAGLATRR